MFDTTFRNIADVVREHAAARPHQPALVQGDRQLTFAELDALMDRVAVALQRDGVRAGDVIALCGSTRRNRRRFSSQACVRVRL